MKTGKNPYHEKRVGKRSYRSPQFNLYGKLTDLTRGGGGDKRESGPTSPKTKIAGGQIE
ncbi:MAG: hypothetical protein R3174_06845 [Gammaproteobacteria bacterium]|nr:hypothetical protein [Gammaproteobacteria bacterium]